MEKDKTKIVTKVAVHLVSNGEGEIKAMIHRDPYSKKHLVFLVTEANCDEIAELIETEEVKEK